MHFFRVSYVNEACERENLKRRHKKKGSRRFRKKSCFESCCFLRRINTITRQARIHDDGLDDEQKRKRCFNSYRGGFFF